MCILSFGKKFCVIESDSFDPENPQRECNRVIVDRFPPSRLQINPLPFTRYSQLTQSQWFFAFYSSNTFQHVADAFNCIGVSSAVLSNKSMSYFLFIFFLFSLSCLFHFEFETHWIATRNAFTCRDKAFHYCCGNRQHVCMPISLLFSI